MDLGADESLEDGAPVEAGNDTASKPTEPLHSTSHACKNCGTILTGEYCHGCGQSAHVHRSFLHVLEEALHGITHFDSKAWRSLPMLVFRPGTLTRNYVMGHRSRYVPPFSMFLASIFAMFLVFAFVGGPGFVRQTIPTQADRVDDAREGVADANQALSDSKSEVSRANAQLVTEQAQPEEASKVNDIAIAQKDVQEAIGAQKEAQARLNAAQKELANVLADPASKAGDTNPDQTQANREASLTELATERKKAVAEGDTAAVAALDTASAIVKATPPTQTTNTQTLELSSDGDWQASFAKFLSEDVKINTPWPTFNKKIKHKLENPELFLYKLQNTAYKFSFLLIPLSLPFIWLLLFWKRGVTLYDHAVFALYSVSFMSFLFLGLAMTAHWIAWGDYLGYVFLAVLAHIFFQFKGAYDSKWFSALWRTLSFVFIFAPISITLFLGSVVVLGAVG
jgi:hypothetical protein